MYQSVCPWENREREEYERQEKRGQVLGFPRWWEAGEKGKKNAINVLQWKKHKVVEANTGGRNWD